MAKLTSLFFIVLLLCFTLSFAARPNPDHKDSQSKTQHAAIAKDKGVKVDESCEGMGEEDCLMRRTLAAHTDYIYTQDADP
ncbi:hypothetical protein AQUCO_06000083v1 [Aquilegia coerulea]|uniref:Phytosulfokine n=1 Tax=Aquilegia coerulea TaxID=218851 RepID=A0A2G5CDZ3_AQUCA|nr:hypothetical protein AQUCO_06000083v1 [Aquilegia coerulea]